MPQTSEIEELSSLSFSDEGQLSEPENTKTLSFTYLQKRNVSTRHKNQTTSSFMTKLSHKTSQTVVQTTYHP